MDSCRIQKLLMSEEYAEFEDKVVLESPFVEINVDGKVLRQVYLGLTQDNFILAMDDCNSYKRIRWERIAIQDAQCDPNVHYFDIIWHIPVCHVQFNIRRSDPLIQKQHVLVVTPRKFPRHERYFILAILGVDPRKAKKKWKEWDDRLRFITEDAEGYVRQLKTIRALPEKFFDQDRCLVRPLDSPLENQRRQNLKAALLNEFILDTHIKRFHDIKSATLDAFNQVQSFWGWNRHLVPETISADDKNKQLTKDDSSVVNIPYPPEPYVQKAKRRSLAGRQAVYELKRAPSKQDPRAQTQLHKQTKRLQTFSVEKDSNGIGTTRRTSGEVQANQVQQQDVKKQRNVAHISTTHPAATGSDREIKSNKKRKRPRKNCCKCWSVRK